MLEAHSMAAAENVDANRQSIATELTSVADQSPQTHITIFISE
jgi:hypothetical protein